MTAEVQTLAILWAFIIFVAEGLERFAEKEIDASPELRRDRDWLERARAALAEHEEGGATL
ncbi:MAG: hypothetical protein WAV07_18510 [Candidatus Contendobacter sp.]